MPLSTGQVLNNRYRVVGLLGQGGMGAVYRAWDMNLKKPVALKENLETTESARHQFEREASMLANLSHPNLPRVTDHFFISGQGQYLVMDFVQGEDLETMVEKGGPLPEDQALAWIAQVCSALNYLHTQPSPVIHRDIKPANIKITPDGRAMLVDFGIAKIYDPHRATTAGAKAVSPGFSPPEQYSGKTDARSDIYSLGATLYTIVTGEVLPESALRAVSSTVVPLPSHLRPELKPSTEQAILKAIEIPTDQRFQRIDDFRTALEKAAKPEASPTMVAPAIPVEQTQVAEPVVPPRRPPVARPARTPSKRPVWLYIAGGLVALIAIVAVVAFASGVLGGGGSTPVAEAPDTNTPVPVDTESPTDIPPTRVEPTQAPSSTLIPQANPPQYTNTPPPTPTPPPPPTPALGPPEFVLEQNVNCRGGPGTSFVLLRTFVSGTVLEIIGHSDNGWWLVRINDPSTRKQQCWISGDTGTAQGDLDRVPFSNWTGDETTAQTPWP